MTRARRLLPVAAIAWAALAGACAHGGGGAPAPVVARDSVRGVVRVTGAEPRSALLLVPASGDPMVPRGADSTRLRQVAGLEVTLFGVATGDCASDVGPRGAQFFDVARFVVRAVNGVAAVDGVLSQGAAVWVITDGAGVAHAVAAVPPMLQAMAGARVYWAGPLGAAPVAYGVIR